MEEKYLIYTLEDWIEDKHFVAWVLRGHNNKEWKAYISNNAQIKEKTQKAREIILLLSDTYDLLEEGEVLKIWHDIEHFERLNRHKTNTVQFRKVFSIAASVLIVISLGIFGFLYLQNQNPANQFVSADLPIDLNKARLVLSDREQVVLDKDKSIISLSNEEIVINDGKTIDLTEKKTDKAKNVQMNEVIIPFGKSSELLLADGTRVWINAGSRLAFPSKFTDKNREVFLEGEACFKVTKNESKPFIVNTNKLAVTVHGTYFDVSAYPADENIETVLVEGSVSIAKKTSLGFRTKNVFLKPYQKATFNREEEQILVVNEPKADAYLAWTEGSFKFSKQNLNSVLTKLERYYNVRFIVPENFPSDEKISGRLDLKGSVEDVMKALADVAKIEYHVDEEKISINKKN